MAKIIDEYNLLNHTFTATEIANRSSNVGDINVVGSTVEVSNITTTDVRTALNETINKVYGLAYSMNVNNDSAFSSWYLELANGTGIIRSIDLGRLGDFACYNHNAPQTIIHPMDLASDGHLKAYYNKSITGCSYVYMGSEVHLGEVNFEGLLGTITDAGISAESGLGMTYDNTIPSTNASYNNGDVYYSIGVEAEAYGTPDGSGNYLGMTYTLKPMLVSNSTNYYPSFMDTTVTVDLYALTDNVALIFDNPNEWLEDMGSGCQPFIPEWDALNPPSVSVNTNGDWSIENLVVVLDDGSNVYWSASTADIYWSYKGSAYQLLTQVDLSNSPVDVYGSGLPTHGPNDCAVYMFKVKPTNSCN